MCAWQLALLGCSRSPSPAPTASSTAAPAPAPSASGRGNPFADTIGEDFPAALPWEDAGPSDECRLARTADIEKALGLPFKLRRQTPDSGGFRICQFEPSGDMSLTLRTDQPVDKANWDRRGLPDTGHDVAGVAEAAYFQPNGSVGELRALKEKTRVTIDLAAKGLAMDGIEAREKALMRMMLARM